MEEVIKLNSVDQYNQMYGLETLHPLVTVVDLSKATLFPTHFTLNLRTVRFVSETNKVRRSTLRTADV